MKTTLSIVAMLLLASCRGWMGGAPQPPTNIFPRAAEPAPAPAVPAPAPVVTVRTADAAGKPTGEYRATGAVTIAPPGHFAEFDDATGPKRLYIRGSKLTVTAE